ncbi:MAG: DsbA family protein, partial [Longimicrobiales bacterium]
AKSTMQSAQATEEPILLSPEVLKNTQQLMAKAQGVKVGPDNAPIRILVFSDFMCPGCKAFATVVEPGMREEYIKTGKVQLVYHDFPLSPNHKWSFVAARAARCAQDQNKFWEFHDMLFNKQSAWSFERTTPTATFEGYARELKLDEDAFSDCLNSDKHAELVTANKALGEQLGVNHTPTLLMSPSGTELSQEWNDYGRMKARLEKELGLIGAPATTTPPTTTTK